MVDIRHHKSLPVYIRPNLVDLGQMLFRSYVEFSFGKLVPGNGVVKFFHPLVHHNKKIGRSTPNSMIVHWGFQQFLAPPSKFSPTSLVTT